MEPLEDRRLLSVGGTVELAGAAGEYDFGDLPDNYGTTLAADGARHESTGPMLGWTRDAESDGLPAVGADGDDTDSAADEDGVTFGTIQVGQLDALVTVNVHAPSGAKLDAWIDFNGDGSFGGAGEQIANSVDVRTGDNTIRFDVPSWAVDGGTYGRFRLSTGGNLESTGAAVDGEVEDYQLVLMPPAAGSQSFDSAKLIATGLEVSGMVATDVDGDGDTDLFVASSHELSWHENAGDGEFVVRSITTTRPELESIFTTDVDGDGDMDGLSASSGDGEITWYENDGDGNFTSHTIAFLTYARAVFAADMDGDGDMDVLSASLDESEIRWYENDGNENFTSHTITVSALFPESVFAADLDGDGDTDVLSASSDDNKIAWYENDGSQNFTGHTITTSAIGAQAVLASDVDGDGDMDVLSASARDDKIAWYENDGSESFTVHVITTAANNARSVAVSDVDGDGDMDVLSASKSDDRIAWYENDGEENFTTHTITASADYASVVVAADVDGDGDMDVLSSPSRDELVWHENDGSQNFTAHIIITTAVGAHCVFAADVDGDGDMDVLSAFADGGRIAWYENRATGSFMAHTITTTANDAWSVFAVDVDRDGDMDVLSASADDDKIAWYENDGNQNFTAHAVSTSADGTRSVFAADVDGDGDLDILSASPRDDRIAWYENSGDQTFTVHTLTTSADGALSVFAADVDGDGDMDVLSASAFDGRIAWYKNDGNENFTTYAITSSLQYPSSVFAVDLDGDGDTDVLSSSKNDDRITWYENDGNESFTTHIISSTTVGAYSVFAADMDGDGDMDVLSAANYKYWSGPWLTYDDELAWYENDGDENFTPHTITQSIRGAVSIVAADVDGDGDLDVLSASSDDHSIAWYEQLGSPEMQWRELDYGDAPGQYGTTLRGDGARHEATGPMLGTLRDAELEGLPTVAADGDDRDGSADEDGVRLDGPIFLGRVGVSAAVNVQNAPTGAKLDAWIDFDRDGSFEGNERIAANLDVLEGDNAITFEVPNWAVVGESYARFRLSSAGNLEPTGSADDGEVEDYAVTIARPVDLGAIDFLELPGINLSGGSKAYSSTVSKNFARALYPFPVTLTRSSYTLARSDCADPASSAASFPPFLA